jgi:adenylate kinase family enzyme
LGCSGSGKSTLALDLSRRLSLPARFIDQQTWLPGWVLRDWKDADVDVWAILSETAWVLDGASLRHLPRALEAADWVIFLDLPRWRCLLRVLGRVWQSWGRVRVEMAPGCPEQFDLSFLGWIWNWQRAYRPKIVTALATRPDALIFQRPGDLKHWLEAL